MYHIQFLASDRSGGLYVLQEYDLIPGDYDSALISLAETPWPSGSLGVRMLDESGATAFFRLLGD